MAIEPFLSTRAQKAFIFTITIQALVVLAMVAITFHFFDDSSLSLTNSRYKTIPCYLALFALAEVFELLMAFDALRLRNVIQLVGILLFHLSLVVFAALQVHQTKTALVTQYTDTGGECSGTTDDYSYTHCGGPGTLWARVEPFLVITPCIIAASWFAILFWVRALYVEFGWAIFHVVGANPKMKTMYQWYQIMICLLKFDFFCFSGVTMQLLIIVLNHDSAEFGLTVAAIPVVLFLLAACGIAVGREIKWLMTVSLAMMLAAMSYFLFKLVRFYEPSTTQQYATTRATLTTFTLVAFVLLFGTFAVGLRCFADFDRGLQASKVNDLRSRPKYSHGPGSAGNKTQQGSYNGGAQLQERISIE